MLKKSLVILTGITSIFLGTETLASKSPLAERVRAVQDTLEISSDITGFNKSSGKESVESSIETREVAQYWNNWNNFWNNWGNYWSNY